MPYINKRNSDRNLNYFHPSFLYWTVCEIHENCCLNAYKLKLNPNNTFSITMEQHDVFVPINVYYVYPIDL